MSNEHPKLGSGREGGRASVLQALSLAGLVGVTGGMLNGCKGSTDEVVQPREQEFTGQNDLVCGEGERVSAQYLSAYLYLPNPNEPDNGPPNDNNFADPSQLTKENGYFKFDIADGVGVGLDGSPIQTLELTNAVELPSHFHERENAKLIVYYGVLVGESRVNCAATLDLHNDNLNADFHTMLSREQDVQVAGPGEVNVSFVVGLDDKPWCYQACPEGEDGESGTADQGETDSADTTTDDNGTTTDTETDDGMTTMDLPPADMGDNDPCPPGEIYGGCFDDEGEAVFNNQGTPECTADALHHIDSWKTALGDNNLLGQPYETWQVIDGKVRRPAESQNGECAWEDVPGSEVTLNLPNIPQNGGLSVGLQPGTVVVDDDYYEMEGDVVGAKIKVNHNDPNVDDSEAIITASVSKNSVG